MELKETLKELLQSFVTRLKREKGVTLNISNEKKKKKRYSKFNVVNIPFPKKKKCSRVCEKHEKMKAASQISVKKTNPKVCNVEEDQVLEENFNFQAPDMFTAKKYVDLTVDSEEDIELEIMNKTVK